MPQCLAQSPMRRLTFPDQFCTPRSGSVYSFCSFCCSRSALRFEFVLDAFAASLRCCLAALRSLRTSCLLAFFFGVSFVMPKVLHRLRADC